jgi:hypothetical protein
MVTRFNFVYCIPGVKFPFQICETYVKGGVLFSFDLVSRINIPSLYPTLEIQNS